MRKNPPLRRYDLCAMFNTLRWCKKRGTVHMAVGKLGKRLAAYVKPTYEQ